MIAVIDNYDSFTYNLVQYLGELGAEVCVYRNDAITAREVEALDPSHVVISPGPGDPSDAGVSNDVIRELGPRRGRCSASAWATSASARCSAEKWCARPRLVHGKTSPIYHYGDGLFVGLPSPFDATRYHSLIVAEPLPEALEITAFTTEGEVMGLRHKTLPVFGVQFHPESILTHGGSQS